MTLDVEHFGLMARGLVREENEDAWSARSEDGLFIVSDGMGGHLGGAVASRIVVEALPELLGKRMAGINDLAESEAQAVVRRALTDLSLLLREQSRNATGLDGMGATVVLLMIRDTTALIAHLGDSRAYLLRKERLQQLTKDHSVLQLLIDAGHITAERGLTHPARGQITRCVGMEGDPVPEVSLFELEPRDRLLLCTDGLTGMVGDREIREILRGDTALQATCRRLVDAANEAGGRDNITAIVLDVRNGNGRKGP